ncbi:MULTISPECIES: hypothetical protein [Paraburkholderia]|uniref:Uncharacterized protein n=1 Tax=Paraburkholderia madseniana TaxID=2599607 RepID=A0AAP5BNV5_9BURK|nr:MULTISPECIES: hypothetical protein [Paraburkholderia]MCX4151979.1 hypothetical protein [Paraburkholderia madseniana]MCX4175601.1 hypothetical protein [Paraburkholderia madseniana]MDN7154907.1 hypothetical protein [Paraburkholderia sp. WS6]MDQ6413790.1 hypothetical protein [Paraburkholderia madseniana]MDQ6463597.1 hypothetical protein [Paraburkholderia madseniana]
MDLRGYIELIAAATIPLGFGAVMAHRFVGKKSIGARVIQLTAVVMLIPVILILALEKILDGATLGTLIGGIVGYLLSGISEYDRGRGNDGP